MNMYYPGSNNGAIRHYITSREKKGVRLNFEGKISFVALFSQPTFNDAQLY